MNLKRKFYLFLAAILLCCLAACAGNESQYVAGDQQILILNQSPDSVWNYHTARNYAAQGRYELAREHYLLALSSASTVEMQAMLARELQGVDKMIKSLR